MNKKNRFPVTMMIFTFVIIMLTMIAAVHNEIQKSNVIPTLICKKTNHRYGYIQWFAKNYGPMLITNAPGFDYATIAAQIATETGYGWRLQNLNTSRWLRGRIVPSNNPGNITASSDWMGKTGYAPVYEYVNGKYYREIREFRRYNTLEEGIQDYIHVIEHKFPDAYAVRHDGDAYLNALQDEYGGKYATDPNYVETIRKVRDTFFEVIMVTQERGATALP